MKVPGLGVLSVSGFTAPGWFALAALAVGLLAMYVAVQLQRRRRVRRYTDPELMGTVAPRRPSRWRHLPVALLLIALVLLSVALAQPTREVRVPRNRAVIMLVIDVSQSMRATDVAPTRLVAAEQAAAEFARNVTTGVNLGLVAFAGNATVLVSPTPQHQATIDALPKLQPADATATGAGIFAALDAIHTVDAVLTGGSGTPPARIVLLSDGKENKPPNPNDPRGGYTAARTAKGQGIPISTIAFGTKTGMVEVKNQAVPVPVDDEMMKQIAALSGGQSFDARDAKELIASYTAIEAQIGYQVVSGPASAAGCAWPC